MRVHALSLLLLWTGAGALRAQEVPASYLAALQHGLSKRLEVGIDRAGADMAAARVSEAQGAFLPTVTALSTLQRNKLHNDFIPIKVGFEYAGENVPVTVANALPPYELSTGLDLRYNLYAGGADRARLDAAHASRRAADAGAELTRRLLVEEVTRAYWSVIKAQVDMRRIRRALEQATAEAQIAGVQYRQGNLAQVEAEVKALAAQVQQAEWESSQRMLADLIRRYLLAIGMDSTAQSVQALQQRPVMEEAHGIAALHPETLLRSLHLSTAAQVRRQRAELDGASAAMAQARAERKPTLDLFVRHQGVGRGATGLEHAVSQYGRDATYIGLQLNWKLFDGFRTDSRIRHASATVEKQRAMVQLAQRNAEYEWQDKSSRAAAVNDKLVLAQKQLALGEAQLKVARMRLETKLGSQTQTQAVANALEDARDRVTGLQIDAFVARVEALLARPQ